MRNKKWQIWIVILLIIHFGVLLISLRYQGGKIESLEKQLSQLPKIHGLDINPQLKFLNSLCNFHSISITENSRMLKEVLNYFELEVDSSVVRTNERSELFEQILALGGCHQDDLDSSKSLIPKSILISREDRITAEVSRIREQIKNLESQVISKENELKKMESANER